MLMRTVVIAAAAIVLAGCYTSEKPLITAANAAYPLTAGHYKSYEWEADQHTWKESGSGTLSRVGDHYLLHHDPAAGEAASAGDDMHFYLSDFGDHVYAAQAQDNDDGKTILLDIVKVEGNTVLEYIMTCEAGDKALADRGVIAKYEHQQYSDTCTVNSLEQLRKAYQARLAAGMVPHGKYVITH